MTGMDRKKQVGVIGMAVSTLLCGIPGVCLLLSGGVAAANPDSFEAVFEADILGTAMVMICVGMAAVLVPAGSGLYTLWVARQMKVREDLLDSKEPLPPAI